MKKVISNRAPNIHVHSTDMSNDKYYGVLSPSGCRGFITREHYHKGLFIVRSASGLTHGNEFQYNGSSLAELAESMMISCYNIFEFDTWRELFRWMMEGDRD